MLISAIPNTLSRRSGEWGDGVVCSKERFEGNDQGNKRKSEESKGKMQRKDKWVETGHCFEVREVHSLVSRIPNAFRPLELRARKGKGSWEQGCEAWSIDLA